jgi:hypothetical protein
MSDYSRLLTKMSELKAIEGEYNTLSTTYQPAISLTTISTTAADTATTRDKYIITPDKNAISNTKTPLVIRPGEDYGEFWKYVGKVDNPVASGSTNAQQINSQKCWNMAANDPRLFKKVVYTGVDKTNAGQPDWDNRCYALTPDAPANASYDTTTATGYSIMVGNGDGSNANKSNDIYTKLGIKPSAQTSQAVVDTNIAKASKLNDLQMRVNSLTQDIVAASDAGINNELNTLVASAAGSNELVGKINQYMNSEVGDISGNYYLMDKRKELNNVYAEINEQTTLRGRKYRFIFYIVVTLFLIIGYASYTSKMSILEQIDTIKNYLSWGWWTNWWIIAIVVILLILSSFGWDMKGNILMVIRYVTDPDFWTGQLWWVGVTFLLLIIIFFYATFKSFFTEFDAGMKSIQSNLDGGDS